MIVSDNFVLPRLFRIIRHFLSESMAEQLLDSVRRTICKMYGEGERCVDIAEKLGIRYRTVVSVIALYRGTSRVVSLRRGHRKEKQGTRA